MEIKNKMSGTPMEIPVHGVSTTKEDVVMQQETRMRTVGCENNLCTGIIVLHKDEDTGSNEWVCNQCNALYR